MSPYNDTLDSDLFTFFGLLGLLFVAFFWLLSAFLIADAARMKGRGFYSWLFVALLNPLVIGGCLLLYPVDQAEVDKQILKKGRHRPCPRCTRPIPNPASACYHCGCQELHSEVAL
ncbi:hypothetical protein [Magnetococcus sp. PR-3]|uniref:hypothetical protein n=1 Tax=Magnetococcus sp. PR-3 TaxID=3120355 RepID=UPI002FCDE48E